ncbi:NAD(P)-binding domain-containing protein [Asanoa sp. WMMD1127]|uniref:NAD(P)-dependent oxidoreductase n=1 Tax=Asanoa sp. WMMD1127 TaxID=3016107 RepID=UPI0024177267|nr:NAD(P)-binding domain-containing protein [Asanoa sp. WMMD1127]MDG4827415.1 NAD(P)-binding domain-containing protein [Asanoa sp. WMMD1127]
MAVMERVTVVGAGAIGSALTRRLLAGGHEVVVWNRTAGRLTGLVDAGARPAPTVGDAVSSSPLTLLAVKDYGAVRDCLSQVGPQPSGRTIVAMCTGTPAEARQAAEQVARLGADYLDAGNQASPEAVGAGLATVLYSGSRSAYERHLPTLEQVSATRFVGAAPDAAAVWDLALFGVWYDAQLGLLRALDTVRAAGIDVAEFAKGAATQLGHVVAAVDGTLAEVRQGSYPPGPADLTEHLMVIRHLVELRTGRPLGDGGLPEVAARLDALIADGRGGEGLTATVG